MRKDTLQGRGLICILLGVFIFVACQFIASGAVHGNPCAEGEGSSSQCQSYNNEINSVCALSLLGMGLSITGIVLFVYSFLGRAPKNYQSGPSVYSNQNPQNPLSSFQQQKMQVAPPANVFLIEKILVLQPRMFEQVELGHLLPYDKIEGTLKQNEGWEFDFHILDERGLIAYNKSEDDSKALISGENKQIYCINAIITELRRYYLVLENFHEDTTMAIEVKLRILRPIE